MSQRIFIIGGGRFGSSLATRLAQLGCEVVIADINPKRVEDLAEDGFHTVELNAEDPDDLRAADVLDADAVVVTIGDNMQSNILATLALQELKVKKLIVRALDPKHAHVLERLGAHLVILPTRDMAYRLAEMLRAGSLSDRIPISGEYQLAQIQIGSKLHNRNLTDLRLPSQYKITVVLIKRASLEPQKEAQSFEPSPNLTLLEGDILVITGRRMNIDHFENECAKR
jgi:trk system potassium uptake protein TrkA